MLSVNKISADGDEADYNNFYYTNPSLAAVSHLFNVPFILEGRDRNLSKRKVSWVGFESGSVDLPDVLFYLLQAISQFASEKPVFISQPRFSQPPDLF